MPINERIENVDRQTARAEHRVHLTPDVVRPCALLLSPQLYVTACNQPLFLARLFWFYYGLWSPYSYEINAIIWERHSRLSLVHINWYYSCIYQREKVCLSDIVKKIGRKNHERDRPHRRRVGWRLIVADGASATYRAHGKKERKRKTKIGNQVTDKWPTFLYRWYYRVDAWRCLRLLVGCMWYLNRAQLIIRECVSLSSVGHGDVAELEEITSCSVHH